MNSYLTTIVEDRWINAVAAPTIPRWRTLADLAGQIADALAENDAENIMVITHRAVQAEAHKRMLAMQPERMEA